MRGIMTKLIKMFYNPKSIHSNMVIDYFMCPKCKTEYPQMYVWDEHHEDYVLKVMCNGKEIRKCPYCK